MVIFQASVLAQCHNGLLIQRFTSVSSGTGGGSDFSTVSTVTDSSSSGDSIQAVPMSGNVTPPR
jgi:hypothetical protein